MSDSSFPQRILDMLDAVTAINIPSRGRGYALEDITLEAMIAQLGLPSAKLFLNGGMAALAEKFPQSAEQMKTMAALDVLGAEPDQILLDHPGTYLVKHPFGKNNWPEFVLHHDGRFLPIEIKSSASGQIVWNGGLPRQNCLYIYNFTAAKGRTRADGTSSGSDSRVTVCFGSDLISPEVYQVLRKNHELVQEFARNLHTETFGEDKPFTEDFGFSEYARAMFNHKKRIHACPETAVWGARTRLRLATWAGADADVLRALQDETVVQERKYAAELAEKAKEQAGQPHKDQKRAARTRPTGDETETKTSDGGTTAGCGGDDSAQTPISDRKDGNGSGAIQQPTVLNSPIDGTAVDQSPASNSLSDEQKTGADVPVMVAPSRRHVFR